MLGNYNKIAIWEGSDYKNPPYNKTSKYVKKINCDFDIKRFFVFIKPKNYSDYARLPGYDSKETTGFKALGLGGYGAGEYRFSVQNKNEVVIEVKNESYVIEFYIKKIIAIG